MLSSAHAQETSAVPTVTGGDELVKEKGRFQETWVLPDADISEYSKLCVWQAPFHFRDVEGKRSGSTTANLKSASEFAIREESKDKFEQVVTAAFVKELERSKLFQVVNKPGPDTLLVRAGVLDIVSSVPPDYSGRADIYLSAVGEATLMSELIDAETGVIQARVGERRRIQPPYRLYEVDAIPANSATVWSDVERWANAAARDLRRELEKALKKAKK